MSTSTEWGRAAGSDSGVLSASAKASTSRGSSTRNQSSMSSPFASSASFDVSDASPAIMSSTDNAPSKSPSLSHARRTPWSASRLTAPLPSTARLSISIASLADVSASTSRLAPFAIAAPALPRADMARSRHSGCSSPNSPPTCHSLLPLSSGLVPASLHTSSASSYRPHSAHALMAAATRGGPNLDANVPSLTNARAGRHNPALPNADPAARTYRS
mmetsp:Transcript_9266/g.27932  ORF Transcript_9266/g.27932 Transcript_9266/m.27932 type:complete len:217 (-) Transcript_9266:1574-2224(-)